MKKNLIFIGLALVVGVLGGWLIFGGSGNDEQAIKDLSDMSDSHDHSADVDLLNAPTNYATRTWRLPNLRNGPHSS